MSFFVPLSNPEDSFHSTHKNPPPPLPPSHLATLQAVVLSVRPVQSMRDSRCAGAMVVIASPPSPLLPLSPLFPHPSPTPPPTFFQSPLRMLPVITTTAPPSKKPFFAGNSGAPGAATSHCLIVTFCPFFPEDRPLFSPSQPVTGLETEPVAS